MARTETPEQTYERIMAANNPLVTDELARSIAWPDWAPDGGTSTNRYKEVAADLDRRFRAALAAQVALAPGLTGHYMDADQGRAPVLQWDEDRDGAYEVSCGISHHLRLPDSALPTFLWVQYSNDSSGERERPLDIKLTDASARDADLLAAMVVFAVSRRAQRRR